MGSWRELLDFLCNTFLDGNFGAVTTPLTVLYIVGLWGIFRKCGVSSWKALIPFYREYELSRCAGKEQDGRKLFCARLGIYLIYLVSTFIVRRETASLLLTVLEVMVGLVSLIYTVRVMLGLCEVFDQKKIWLIGWLLADGIVAVLWGFLDRFQPLWKVEELDRSEVSEFFSGARAEVTGSGLTVNIEERTTWEMFKKKYLLRDIHMNIQPGRMVLLLGGSGAGKTTFVNAVNGYEPAKAEITLNGTNLYNNYRQMQYDIGFVPQQDLMRGSDQVSRTLMDAAALRLPTEFTRAERQARVEEVMEIFGLTPVMNNLVSKLSGGQRKRLSIAMEFISNPSLFILDDPDSGLDGVMARELFEQLRRIADQGKIVIVITHTPDRVIDLFDDVIVLAKDASRTGRLAWFGPVQEAREFFGRETMEEIVKTVNRKEEGGEGRADEFILKYAEGAREAVQHV